jgi:ankyrin repeat protein
MERLLETASHVNTKHGSTGEIPLHTAAKHNRVSMVRYLLERGSHINAKDDKGYTPLHAAAKHGKMGSIASLVDGGASIQYASHRGETPLHLAAVHGHGNAVEYLIDRGARINAHGFQKSTPLHEAVWKGHPTIVSLLVRKGASVNAKDDYGRTPLHIVAGRRRRGSTAIATTLIEHGADMTAMDNDGRTPLRYALEYRHPEMIQLLVRHGALRTYRSIENAVQWITLPDPTRNVRYLKQSVKSVPYTLNRPSRPQITLHNSANGVDVATTNKVPLHDARIIHLPANGKIRHIFHKNTVTQLLQTRPRHPFTRQPFSSKNVYKLKDVLHPDERVIYNRIGHRLNVGRARQN